MFVLARSLPDRRPATLYGTSLMKLADTSVDILPAASGEDSYGVGFLVRSLQRVPPTTALTSAEDNEEALLLGYPPIGLVDKNEFRMTDSKNARALYPRPETPRLYGQNW
jgi:hypothetical protein